MTFIFMLGLGLISTLSSSPSSGGGEGGGSGAYGYFASIPASMYGLLLGRCRLGTEPLVYGVLHDYNIMSNISVEQLHDAWIQSEKYGHHKITKCLQHLARSVSR